MIIKATNITKSFGQLEVLKGIDFEAGKGEVVAIVGASGAGKSTLLQILGTLSTPDSGSLIIEDKVIFAGGNGADRMLGRKLSDSELARFRGARIGFVFQQHHLLPEFTAIENVMIPALIAGGRSRKEIEDEARELLSKVGLEQRAGHKPSELSGGEQQRVAIARALINKPAILFADEPSGNLDSVTKQEIHQLFFDLRSTLGQTIVIVTHDLQLAGMCDRYLTMKDGQFVAE